jgi:hypothetical protein
MKKILLSALCLCTTVALSAQITKGSLAVTGIIGLNGGNSETSQLDMNNSLAKTSDSKNSSFNLIPSVTYFLSDKLEAGIAFALTNSKSTTNYVPSSPFPGQTLKQESKTPLNGFALLANYYFVNNAKFACYGGIQLGMGSGTGETTTTTSTANPGVNTESTTETKNSGTTFGFNSGFLYFVKSNLAFNASLGLISLNSSKTENMSTTGVVTSETKGSNWSVGVNGVIVNIGVKWFIMGGSGE